ncbi:hypothetical protein KRR39_05865 [Nocardioides panacis]|uniref:Uncharacterized protein n=1 Tax=Nocardioides panacis TaxID=2849501 RepID=A0A975T0E0_9ACTN|nr:hypothetical protein [Nocardioides panacis]QWZ09310.1 hypothetical protein KRR39_05865 [Nocardioides panacis]
MPRHSLDRSPSYGGPLPPAQREGSCDLYSPGHQIHYRHQGDAVRSPSRLVANAILEGTRLTLVMDDDTEMVWRHHDPVRLGRILELVPSKRVAYPRFHALRVGPYWFNCAPETEPWRDCRLSAPAGPA